MQGRPQIPAMSHRRPLPIVSARLETASSMIVLMLGYATDMLIAGSGRAFIGNFAFDLFAGGPPKTTCLVAVDSDGHTRVVADELSFPNGSVITPDGKTLIVAETFAGTLTAFNVK